MSDAGGGLSTLQSPQHPSFLPDPSRKALAKQPYNVSAADRVSHYAHLVARESQLFFQHLHPLAAATQSNDADETSLSTTWSDAEVDALLASLSRHSRLRPDLIAADLAPHKTLPEIQHLVSLFEDAQASQYSRKRSRKVWEECEPAVEMSDEWVREEERLAGCIADAEHFVGLRMAGGGGEEYLDPVSWDEQLANAMLWLHTTTQGRPNAMVFSEDDQAASSSTAPPPRLCFTFTVSEARRALQGKRDMSGKKQPVRSTLQAFATLHPVPRIMRKKTAAMLRLVLREGVKRGFLAVLKAVPGETSDGVPSYRVEQGQRALVKTDVLTWRATLKGEGEDMASVALRQAQRRGTKRLLSQLGIDELRWFGEHLQQAAPPDAAPQPYDGPAEQQVKQGGRVLFMGVDLTPFPFSERHKIKMRMRQREAKYGREVAVRTAFDAKWGMRKRWVEEEAREQGREREKEKDRPPAMAALGLGKRDVEEGEGRQEALATFADDTELLDLGRLAALIERRSVKTISHDTLRQLTRLVRARVQRLMLDVIEECEATNGRQSVKEIHVQRALARLSPSVACSIGWPVDEKQPTSSSIEAGCDHSSPHRIKDLLDGVDFAGPAGGTEGRISASDAFVNADWSRSYARLDRINFQRKSAASTATLSRRSTTAPPRLSSAAPTTAVDADEDDEGGSAYTESSLEDVEAIESDLSSLYEDTEEEVEVNLLRSRSRRATSTFGAGAGVKSEANAEGEGARAGAMDVDVDVDVDPEVDTRRKRARKTTRADAKDQIVTQRLETRDAQRDQREERLLWGWGLSAIPQSEVEQISLSSSGEEEDDED